MASDRNRVSRSLSQDIDSDGEFVDDGATNGEQATHPGKPGRKKNPNSQAARRDQNRIAQREFRLRKQQKIRDLEARVEILSGSKDETYGQMRDIITELISENQRLRNIVRGLSDFIGDGAGGLLPRLGWSPQEFEAFISKADTDTAYEAFAKRRRAVLEGRIPASAGGAGAPGAAAAGTSSSSEKRAAPPTSDDAEASRKRARTFPPPPSATDVGFSPASVGPPTPSFAQTAYGAAPPPPGTPGLDLYSSLRTPPGFPSGFLSGLPGAQTQHGSSPFASAAGSPLGFGPSPQNGREGGGGGFPAFAQPGPPGSYTPPQQGQQGQQQQQQPAPQPPPQPSSEADSSSMEEELLVDPKAQEARKLVGYHLDNYRRNSAYCLPPSLRPTLVQRTVEHETIIDGIPHPDLRNRMILLRGRFNLVDCIHDYLTMTTIHGDDVLGHANWEIQEGWLKKYGYLVDTTTLNLTNRWRKERGEPEISMADITTSEPPQGMAAPS